MSGLLTYDIILDQPLSDSLGTSTASPAFQRRAEAPFRPALGRLSGQSGHARSVRTEQSATFIGRLGYPGYADEQIPVRPIDVFHEENISETGESETIPKRDFSWPFLPSILIDVPRGRIRGPILIYNLIDASSEGPKQTWDEIAPDIHDARLRDLFDQIQSFAAEENFEDGMQSQFSQALLSFVSEHKQSALDVILDYVVEDRLNLEIASETIRWLPKAATPELRPFILNIVGLCLRSKHVILRDAAIVSLYALEEATMIPQIKRALESERIDTLKDDLLELLSSLEGIR